MKDVDEIIQSLTLEEKASLCQGATFWTTREISEKGVPEIIMTDGPHGLRKQNGEADHLGVNPSVPATCFPSAAAICCSWDEGLIRRIGQALGEECQQEGVSVLLGPGVNMKRSPLCGRNFEYFSEDPYLSSNMAKNHIQGVQSQGVGTSLKHFAVNNQETRRMTVDVRTDERTLREIYLASFEAAVKEAKPWSVMAAYNKVNGEYCCENHHLLKEILRDEWGYDGVALSDWGAANDQIKGIPEGFDLRMPFSGERYQELIVHAVKDGTLKEEALDQTVRRILAMVKKGIEGHRTGFCYDADAHHELAVEAAAESAVLLKNNDSTLPFDKTEKIAVIGRLAQHIRYQGGGSSNVNPTRLRNLLEVLDQDYPDISYEYAPGYRLKKDVSDDDYTEAALRCAAGSDKILYCMGLPYGWESEGFDRKHLRVPDNQVELLKSMKGLGKPIVVLLFTGSPVEMPWLDQTDAVLAMYTAGQGMSEAAWKLLYGEKNPCGKLAETWPLSLWHTPCSLNYPQKETAVYEEGIYIGYRYYDKKMLDTLFDFGYGLSYTTWDYTNLRVSSDTFDAEKPDSVLNVQVDVTNTGTRAGSEIVELYVKKTDPQVSRPVKELKGFRKICCKPGETKTATFTLDKRSFAYYSTKIHDWYAESGEYMIMAGAAVRDIRAETSVNVESRPLPVHYHRYSTAEEVMETERGRRIMGEIMSSLMPADAGQTETEEKTPDPADDEDNITDVSIDAEAMGATIALIKMPDMAPGMITPEAIDELIRKLNETNNEVKNETSSF